MPYVPRENRPPLFLPAEALRFKITKLCAEKGKPRLTGWGYMRYVAEKVIEGTALDAAEGYQGKRGTRYWLIVDHAGIALNIAFELFDRVWLRNPDRGHDLFHFRPLDPAIVPIPEDASLLDEKIKTLVEEIAHISGPQGYNYDGAYCGMDNYSLTELMPRILRQLNVGVGRPNTWSDVENLICFWLMVARTLYTKIARPYEEEQIKKNGDIKIYGEMLNDLLGVQP